MKVFVYGTLMSGQGNNHQMDGATLLGPDVLDGYVLHDIGHFPGIVAGEGRVYGELYEVTALHMIALDRFEGCPRLYRRVPVALESGEAAHVYVFARTVSPYPRVLGGDWRSRCASL